MQENPVPKIPANFSRQLIDFFQGYCPSYLNLFTQSYNQLLSACLTEALASNQLNFEPLLALVNFQHIPTPSNLCTVLLPRGQQAFKCRQCSYEQNSIYCINCFDLSKHKGHTISKFSTCGGCCDCGDQEKLAKESFCDKHGADKLIEVVIKEAEVNRFKLQVGYMMKCLAWIADMDAIRENRIDGQINMTDVYGETVMKQLVEYNKGSLISCKMTHTLLHEKVEFRGREINVINLLFDLGSLPRISRCTVDVCIQLFVVPGFRRQITLLFFSHYNALPELNYSELANLACQLLTSYKTIQALVCDREDINNFQPLLFKPTVVEFVTIANGFWAYYNIFHYLLRLYDGVNQIYLIFHLQKANINDFMGYRALVTLQNNIKDYYGIEERLLCQMASIVALMVKITILPHRDLFNKPLHQLYRFMRTIKVHQVHYNNKVYFSQQRAFALMTMGYLQNNISRLDDEYVMNEFVLMTGANKENVERIISNVIYIFYQHAEVMSNRILIERYYTYYVNVFKKSPMIFSCDAMLFQIVLKMADHFKIEYSLAKDQSFKQCCQGVQRCLNAGFETNFADKLQDFTFAVKRLTDLLSLLLEAGGSSLAGTVIKSHLDILDQNDFWQIYESLLLRTGPIHKKDFSNITSKFVNEGVVLKRFMAEHTGKTGDLNIIQSASESKLTPFNIQYAHSVSAVLGPLLSNTKATSPPLSLVPYFMRKPNKQFFVEASQHILDLSARCLDYLMCPEFKMMGNNISNILLSLVWKMQALQVVKEENCKAWLQKLFQKQGINSVLTSALYRQISEMLQLNKKISGVQPAKKSHKKESLMQKLKDKRNQFLKEYGVAEVPLEVQDQLKCLICQIVDPKKHLALLCFVQMENLYNHLIFGPHLVIKNCQCGNYVHLECYEIANAKKIYKYCDLCRDSVNLILPTSRSDDSPKQQQFKQKLLTRNLRNSIERIEEDYQIKLTPFRTLLKSISSEIVLTGLLRPALFCSKMQKVSTNLLQLFKNLGRLDEDYKSYLYQIKQERHFQLKSQNKNDQTLIQLLQYTCNKTLGFVCEGQLRIFDKEINIPKTMEQGCIMNQKRNEAIITRFPEACKRIDAIFKALCTNSKIQFSQSQGIEIVLQPILDLGFSKKLLPANLQELYQQNIGKCKNCGQITDNMAICLICSCFKTCIGCPLQSLMKHSKEYHGGSSVFIQVNNGSAFYISFDRMWLFPSLYENYRCFPYRSLAEVLYRCEFYLNESAFKNVLKDIMEYRIEQVIRVQEKKQGQVMIVPANRNGQNIV